HECVDELLENNLPGNGLRGFGHCHDIELCQALQPRARQRTPALLGTRSVRAELGKLFLELLDLAGCAPLRIGGMRGFERALRRGSRPTAEEVAGLELIRQRLDLDEATLAR